MTSRKGARRGVLIVLDGQDGTGKATQTKLLIAKLKQLRIPAKTLDFPGYERGLFGKLI